MGIVRTNYFRVTDKSYYDKLCKNLCAEDTIHFWEKTIDGIPHVGFGCYAPIFYHCNETPENLEDTFFPEMQKIIADDDAMILMEAGHEKLRYVVGFVTIVTKDKISHIDTTVEALKKAKELLGNPNFKTEMDY